MDIQLLPTKYWRNSIITVFV